MGARPATAPTPGTRNAPPPPTATVPGGTGSNREWSAPSEMNVENRCWEGGPGSTGSGPNDEPGDTGDVSTLATAAVTGSAVQRCPSKWVRVATCQYVGTGESATNISSSERPVITAPRSSTRSLV